MTQAEEFLDIAARCRRLAPTCRDAELAAELTEIADELAARANEMGQERRITSEAAE
ncbi:MAG: hypothetical protein ACLPKB_25645 [Xanthobacteraceae bacterium]